MSDPEKIAEGADALAWLASPANPDMEMRAKAREVLDKLFYLTVHCPQGVNARIGK